MWPNLAVLEDAPTTAKWLDVKKVLMDASVVMTGGGCDGSCRTRLSRRGYRKMW